MSGMGFEAWLIGCRMLGGDPGGATEPLEQDLEEEEEVASVSVPSLPAIGNMLLPSF